MSNSLSITKSDFSDGEIPDWFKGPEKALALIPRFNERYESLKSIIDSDGIDYSKLQELEKFARDFFCAWMANSKAVFANHSSVNVMKALELLSVYRECVWDYSDYSYYEQLPDKIEIFRGGSGTLEDVLLGFSWSLSKSVAERFANSSQHGIVIKAEIAKNDVLLVLPEESEIVPRLGSLSNIVRV